MRLHITRRSLSLSLVGGIVAAFVTGWIEPIFGAVGLYVPKALSTLHFEDVNTRYGPDGIVVGVHDHGLCSEMWVLTIYDNDAEGVAAGRHRTLIRPTSSARRATPPTAIAVLELAASTAYDISIQIKIAKQSRRIRNKYRCKDTLYLYEVITTRMKNDRIQNDHCQNNCYGYK